VDRRALPAFKESGRDSAFPPVASGAHVAETLSGILADLLGVAHAKADDNFFEMGGHSLLATRAVGRMREAFGVEVPLRVFFERPTLASLAEYVETALRIRGGLTYEALRPTDREGEAPLSFAQQRLWFLNQLEPDSSAYNITGGVRLRGALNIAALEQSLSE